MAVKGQQHMRRVISLRSRCYSHELHSSLCRVFNSEGRGQRWVAERYETAILVSVFEPVDSRRLSWLFHYGIRTWSILFSSAGPQQAAADEDSQHETGGDIKGDVSQRDEGS